ncbi:uncharacterized protein LOC132600310 [Lycium barbarum]|uniref:uncharacterized protein LOC132600310 n=1 Tax=Lycium barbarum TaxID=112863 RepID=UPI00293E9EFE|nr:uncharacterized protein LOC132600310 [Lycium barbarum]
MSEIAVSGVLVREEEGLELAKSLGAEIIEAKCDSLLVVNQVNGTFKVKDDRMQRYLEKLQVVLRRFKEWTLEHVSRDQSNEADALANLGSSVESDRFNSGTVVQLMRSVIETGHAEHRHSKRSRRKKLLISYMTICRFGVPVEIACDNGKQFIGSKLSNFFEDYKIKKILSTPYHPSANGHAESTNKIILQNLKKRLTDCKHRWKEVLPEVLWAYRTTVRSSTEEISFSLVYGAEALIPVEVGEPSLRFQYATEDSYHEAMSASLNLVNEKREAAYIWIAAQKQRMQRYYNRRANFRHFQIGNLVLRKVTLHTKNPTKENYPRTGKGHIESQA